MRCVSIAIVLLMVVQVMSQQGPPRRRVRTLQERQSIMSRWQARRQQRRQGGQGVASMGLKTAQRFDNDDYMKNQFRRKNQWFARAQEEGRIRVTEVTPELRGRGNVAVKKYRRDVLERMVRRYGEQNRGQIEAKLAVMDVDHRLDLQLGGHPTDRKNLKFLHRTVNRSAGVQVRNLMQQYGGPQYANAEIPTD